VRLNEGEKLTMKSLLAILLFVLISTHAVAAQVAAEHVEPSPPPPPSITEVQSPMKLTILLGADEKHLNSVVDLEVNHSRRFIETAKFVVDRMQVTEVRAGKRLGKGKKEELLVTAYLKTEWFRQKVDLSLALLGGGKTVWTWNDRVVLGMKAGDIIAGGALGALNASKGEKVEVPVPLTAELRKSLETDPRLEIVVSIVD
jgi:hypothetical protein